jgi:glycine betaine/proline transport system permease protein
MVLSVVIIAGLIGGGGLGLEVLRGLNHDPGRGMVAGICILLLAIVIDRITQAMGQPTARKASANGRPLGWLFGTSKSRQSTVQVGVSAVSMDPGKGEV